jgi:serine/threonine protein kinase
MYYLIALISLQRARFYAAEIVLAIEALHADGFIYRW